MATQKGNAAKSGKTQAETQKGPYKNAHTTTRNPETCPQCARPQNYPIKTKINTKDDHNKRKQHLPRVCRILKCPKAGLHRQNIIMA